MAESQSNSTIRTQETPPFINLLRQVNLGLRGLMEFGIILAFGYWGYQTGSTLIMRIVLAVAAPLLMFGFWGLVDFHNAGQIAEPLRLIQELIITGLATAALFVAGALIFAWIMGLVSVVHHALVYPLGGTLLKS